PNHVPNGHLRKGQRLSIADCRSPIEPAPGRRRPHVAHHPTSRGTRLGGGLATIVTAGVPAASPRASSVALTTWLPLSHGSERGTGVRAPRRLGGGGSPPAGTPRHERHSARPYHPPARARDHVSDGTKPFRSLLPPSQPIGFTWLCATLDHVCTPLCPVWTRLHTAGPPHHDHLLRSSRTRPGRLSSPQ